MLTTAATTRVGVTVTFLRMDRRQGPEHAPALGLPADCALLRVARCTVSFYRYLYDTVGSSYVWWLRRTLSDAALASLLGAEGVSVHVLYRGSEPWGFFEIDRRADPVTNLSYFGLLPHAVGQGLGSGFLAAAVAEAWEGDTASVTVNTCTADHPRALPGYERAGFVAVRRVNEVWEVPVRLGLSVPRKLLL